MLINEKKILQGVHDYPFNLDETQYLLYEQWVHDYMLSFSSSEKIYQEMYDIKYQHTLDIVKVADYLSKELALSSKHHLAKAIALFHDVGRFEQCRQYKTFKDHESVDHAELSVSILKEKDLLSDLQPQLIDLINCAVTTHNKINIVDVNDDCERFFCNFVRDSDKLSLIPFFIERYKKFTDEVNSSIKPEILESVLSSNPVDNSTIETLNEWKLYHLSWINGLAFKPSWELIMNEKYVDQIISGIPDAEVRTTIKDRFNTRFDEIINGPSLIINF